MSNRKFSLYANKFYEEMRQHYVETMREALKQAISVAVRNTHHDSSQAAMYWMVGIEGHTNPADRTPTNIPGEDSEGNVSTGNLAYLHGWYRPVGFKGDGGSNAEAVATHVEAREAAQAIDKYIVGQVFPTKITLYNKVMIFEDRPGKGGIDYSKAAGIRDAAQAGLEQARAVFASSLKKKRYR